MSLFSDLGTLESAGLIQVANVEPDLEYLFRHALVQDAAYASLLESDRKRLHLAVGDAIEDLYPDRNKELAAILGYHFREAGQGERALSYFLIAGDEALAAFANQEAEIQYRNGLELICCSDAEIARLYTGLGEALFRQSRLEESLQALHTGIDIYQSLGDFDGIARLYARLGRIHWYAGNRPEGLRISLEGLDLVKDAPESWGKATLIHEAARAYYFNGMSDKALPLCRQALALAEKLGAVDIQADALATMGILAGVSAEESLESLRKSVDLAEANGFLQIAMRAHQNLGTMTRTWLVDNQAAMDNFRRAAELGRLCGVAAEELMSMLSYLGCLFAPGRFNEIEAELPRMEELAGKISNPDPSLKEIKFLRGALIGARGDWKTATSIYRECLEGARQTQNLEYELNLINELTWMLLELNRWGTLSDLGEVEKLLQEALEIIERDNSNEKMWAYPRMSVLRARQGQLEEARQWLEKARQVSAKRPSTWDPFMQSGCEAEIAFTEKNWKEAFKAVELIATWQARHGFRCYWAEALLNWANLHIQRGEPADMERAQTLLREALAVFDELGVGYYREIAQEQLQVVRAKIHTQTLEHEQMTKELKKARQVQESLLPENPPEITGWELAVALEPAHETSGDFYDFLPLPDGKLGLVIADVTDKGTSAALFMALSRSLWRTFAVNYPTEPERAVTETNRRILTDTHGGLFITLIYGILDPLLNTFTYCSAGHHPAILLRARDALVEELNRTGIPLGVFAEASWDKVSIEIEPGDTLVLYTDGITDAQNATQQFFGMERLQDAVRTHQGKPAKEILEALLSEVKDWVGNAPQFDDITLMVMVRSKAPH